MPNNPSSWGAFAEGIAGGIKGGSENYFAGVLKKIDRDEKRAIAQGEMSYKIFTDTNLPVEVRKRAYKAWQTGNKDWDTGIQAPDFPDEYWKNDKLTSYFKKGQAILKNKEYSIQEKMEFLQGIEREAMDALGTTATDVLKPLKAEAAYGYSQELKGLTPEIPVTEDEKARFYGMTGKKFTEYYPEKKAETDREFFKHDPKGYKAYKAAGRKAVDEAPPGHTEKRMAEKELRDTENTIRLNPTNEAISPQVDFFNSKSTKNYFFIPKITKHFFGSDTMRFEKFILPKEVTEKGWTARLIRKKAKEQGLSPADAMRQWGIIE